MSIIFLDWDGVINILEEQRVNPTSVASLNFITDGTDAEIVIISMRRVLGIDYFKDLFNKNNITGNIVDIFPRISFETRGQLIKKYLKTHPKCDYYVVLDDNIADYDKEMRKNHVIQPNKSKGLTKRNALKAIKILTGW